MSLDVVIKSPENWNSFGISEMLLTWPVKVFHRRFWYMQSKEAIERHAVENFVPALRPGVN